MQSVIYVFEVLINVDSWVSVTGLVRSQKLDQDLYWTYIILGNYSQLTQHFSGYFKSNSKASQPQVGRVEVED